MKKIIIACLVCFTFTVIGCTANERAKNFGGTQTINLPAGNKLFDVTWKGDSLWFAYQTMEEGQEPVTTTYEQKSSYGVFEGKVIFKESKK